MKRVALRRHGVDGRRRHVGAGRTAAAAGQVVAEVFAEAFDRPDLLNRQSPHNPAYPIKSPIERPQISTLTAFRRPLPSRSRFGQIPAARPSPTPGSTALRSAACARKGFTSRGGVRRGVRLRRPDRLRTDQRHRPQGVPRAGLPAAAQRPDRGPPGGARGGGRPRLRGGEGRRATPRRTARCTCSGFLERDELFGELLTHPIAFPYMWGLAGWNIYTHHNHLDVTPPALEPEKPYWGWHQDGYRQNSDPETMDPNLPRPMFSLKVAYVLSDLSETRPRRDEGHPGQPPVELAAPPGRPDRAEPRPRGRGRDHRQPRRRVHLRPPPVALALARTCRRSPARCCSSATPTGGSARWTSCTPTWTASGGPTARRCSAS